MASYSQQTQTIEAKNFQNVAIINDDFKNLKKDDLILIRIFKVGNPVSQNPILEIDLI